MVVAGIRMKGRYAECGASFGKIGKALARFICGKPLLLHYDAEFRETDAEFEACMPVRGGKSTAEISVRELEGGRYEPVQKLLRDFWTCADGVVPLWADIVASQSKGFELGL
jgi:hypothetical protein